MLNFKMLQARLLAIALSVLPPGPFSLSMLEKLAGVSVSGAELRLGLWRLKRDGLLAVLQKLTGESLYLVPFRKQLEWMPKLFGLPPMREEDPAGIRPFRGLERHDVMMDMLVLVDRISKQRPTVTKKGTVSKKISDQWLSLIGFDQETADRLLRSKQANSPYPAVVSILLDLCFRAELLAVEDGRLAPKKEGLQSWLRLSDEHKRRMIHRLWLQVFCPSDSLAKYVAFVLFELPAGQWVSVKELRSWWMETLKRLFTIDSEVNEEEWLLAVEWMHEAGWLECGQSEAGETYIRRLGQSGRSVEAERDTRPIYVQPDFEVMLQADLHYTLHYMLLGLSEKIRSDRMCVYRLTSQSVAAAYARGWTSGRILDFLRENAANGVPDTVAQVLSDWERVHDRIRFEPAVAVKFASEEEADEWSALPELRLLLGKQNRLNRTTFIVDEPAKKRIREICGRLGLGEAAASPSQREETRDERLCDSAEASDSTDGSPYETEPNAPGLFHSPFKMEAYRKVDAETSPADLYPGLEGIPAMWLHESRSYHPSTLKTIIEQAIDWRCYVQASFGNDSVVFAPTRIQARSSLPIVEGYRGGKLFSAALSDLGPVRLLLPGIHDDKKFISNSKGIRDMIEKV